MGSTPGMDNNGTPEDPSDDKPLPGHNEVGQHSFAMVTAAGVENVAVCQQCHDPLCADVCVMGAIRKDEETGALLVNEALCVGCRTCVIACPFGGALYHYFKGCAMKCDLCGGDPECVKSCLYRAIEYLPMDEWGRRQRLKGAENLGRVFDVVYRR